MTVANAGSGCFSNISLSRGIHYYAITENHSTDRKRVHRGILRSPFHAMLSKNTLLLGFTGRTSGKQYTTPVNYTRVGDELLIFSKKNRTWWRNLRGGAPLVFRLQGRTITGWGVAFEDEAEVESG